MTQLLLFDTPAAKSFAPIRPVAESNVTESNSPLPEGKMAATAPCAQHQRGLNHMGDLARLVLLRYDLVAQRRARRLAKEMAEA